MANLYYKLRSFSGGLNSRQDSRDIRDDQMSKALGISVDKIGMLKTVGGITAHSEVPTQTSIIAPGSGLKVYSSDHWRESAPTIADMLADGDATSDQQTEGATMAGWSATGNVANDVADEDNGIASNGTTLIGKFVPGSGVEYIYQAITTVIGQEYSVVASMYEFNTTGIIVSYNLRVGASAGSASLGQIAANAPAEWKVRELRFIAASTTSYISLGATTSGGGATVYMDDVYMTEVLPSDISGDWLALTDVANVEVDLYNDNDDSFTNGDIDFGSNSTYVANADSINFPTSSTITDADNLFLNSGMEKGQIWKLSNTDGATNDILIILTHVSAGILTVRGTPITIDADNDSAVTFTKYNPTSFHFVNEALRASPIGAGVALTPKHYSYIERIHFATRSSDTSPYVPLGFGSEYNNWFEKFIEPAAPTDQNVSTDSSGDRDVTGDLTAGAGFELGITDNPAATGGEWPVGTWDVSSSFIYDDGQESALYIPPTPQTFITTADSTQSMAIRAHNDGDSYNPRISGGRVYCRRTLSDDAWILLADIDMTQGSRSTLSGNFNVWNDGTTALTLFSDGYTSYRQNSDTYEGLTGLFPDTIREGFEDVNNYWSSSVIAGSRCFLYDARYTNSSGITSRSADRILYSEPGSYDIFPIDNFIDVVRGDADDYVTGYVFGGTLLAFKQRHLYLIDINSPDPADWGMLQDSRKGKYPFRGLSHAAAVFETPYGPAWCNEWGVWLYNGQDVVDLLGDKIDFDDWNSFWTDYSIVGYFAKSDLLVLMRDCTGQGGSTVDETMIFNFKLQAWTTADDLFDTSLKYTNFETDWNQDLIIGEESSGTVTIKKFTDTQTSQTTDNIEWITKDIDFGTAAAMDSVYDIIITYKSSAAQTTPVYYALNGTETWAALTGNFVDTNNIWAELVLKHDGTYIDCYSIRFRGKNPTNAGTMEVNDITIAYLPLVDKVE